MHGCWNVFYSEETLVLSFLFLFLVSLFSLSSLLPSSSRSRFFFLTTISQTNKWISKFCYVFFLPSCFPFFSFFFLYFNTIPLYLSLHVNNLYSRDYISRYCYGVVCDMYKICVSKTSVLINV